MSTKPTTPEPNSSDRDGASDPRTGDARAAEHHDPHAGVSDDPRVDSTPDRRQST